MRVGRRFNPGITASYFITRRLLYKEIKETAHLLNGKMLDFGCGNKPYKSLIRVNEYVGLDFQGAGHPHDDEQIDVFYDGKSIPFKENVFDSILSTEVFEHIFNLEEVLPELFRVLKEDGVIVCTMPFIIAAHEAPQDCVRYTEYGITELLKRKGFTVVSHKKLGSSIEAQMQMFMSYLDSYVICKFKKIGLYKLMAPLIFSCLNIWTFLLNAIFPKRYDAFLNHVIICKKQKQ